MSTTSTAESVVTAVSPARVLQADAGDLRLLFRWLTAMLFIAAALAACVWTRMAVRHTALELDATRSAVTRAEITRERLLVERSLLRDPGRLQSTASALGLVAPVETVTIREGQTP